MPDCQMPQPVATAVNEVMRGVRRLIRTTWHAEEHYPFASIDGFLEALNPLCAKAGLIILQNEVDARLVNDGGNTQDRDWLWVTFEFQLAHSGGATWGSVTRSIMVAANGPQAFGAAQSYALKQFMRSLFQVPTGEMDDPDFGDAAHPSNRLRRRIAQSFTENEPAHRHSPFVRRHTVSALEDDVPSPGMAEKTAASS